MRYGDARVKTIIDTLHENVVDVDLRGCHFNDFQIELIAILFIILQRIHFCHSWVQER